ILTLLLVIYAVQTDHRKVFGQTHHHVGVINRHSLSTYILVCRKDHRSKFKVLAELDQQFFIGTGRTSTIYFSTHPVPDQATRGFQEHIVFFSLDIVHHIVYDDTSLFHHFDNLRPAHPPPGPSKHGIGGGGTVFVERSPVVGK